MADERKTGPQAWLVRLLIALAASAVLAWFVAGFVGCRHAGLV